jgi:anaerobic selenocysteine-containing dehydrogenase
MDRWLRRPYSNYTDAVVDRPGDVLNEWEVFWELARRLGSTLPFRGGSPDMAARPDDHEIIDLAYHGSRMPIDEARAGRGVVRNDLTMVADPADEDADARFTVAPDDLMAELAEVAAADPDPRFPYRLVSRRLKHVLNSLGAELPSLGSKGSTNPAYMHPDDVAELGVQAGDLVRIRSARSSLVAVVEPADDVKRGVISIAHSWGGSSLTDEKVRDIGTPTNRLVSTDTDYDPVTGMVVQSAIPVAVTPNDRHR